MRQPVYPCKIGLHLKVSIGNEHELFMGHVVDTINQSETANGLGPWIEYELPINLMHQHYVVSNLLNPMTSGHFQAHGVVFLTESDKITTTQKEQDALRFDVKKIDFIYNPEYDILQ